VKIATITRRSRSTRSGSCAAAICAGVPGGERGRRLVAVAELEAGQEPRCGEVALEVGEDLAGLVAVAALGQELPELDGRLLLARVELESPSQRCLVAGAGEPVGLRGGDSVEEGRHLSGRDRTRELGRDGAVLERLDGGNALDPELGGEGLVGVDVDLGEIDVARPLGRLGLERGTELAAGTAPLGPEVDDDRHLAGAVEHVLLEGVLGDVVNHGQEA
jgi:hypothetical protein